MAKAVLSLQFPWELATLRALPEPESEISVTAAGMPLLAVPDDCQLSFPRHPHQPARLGGPVDWQGRRLQLWSLPSPHSQGETTITLRIHDGQGASQHRPLRLVGNMGRYDKDQPRDPHNLRALDREMLIGMVVELVVNLLDIDRVELASQGRIRGLVRSSWVRVKELLLADRDVAEPSMALIVRHARDLHRLVGELGQHPRRVLTRNRRMQPVQRIQEMDSACLSWYVRQPGRTPLEKAGSRQALLAVVREETIDTPENRVLRDFLDRSSQAAERYMGANRNLSGSTRYREVGRYGRTCATLLRRPDLAAVRKLAGAAKPNYVLTSDQRYRRIWEAYQALLRRQDDVDEAWSWQARLWGDLVIMAVQTALLSVSEPIALAPLYLHREQDRGRWLDAHDCIGVFATSRQVFMVYVADAAAEATLSEPCRRYAALAPLLVIRGAEFGGGARQDTLIWAVADVGLEPLSLQQATRSASQALVAWHRDPSRHFHGHPRAHRGILVMPAETTSPTQIAAPLQTSTSGDVIGLRLPLSPDRLNDGIGCLGSLMLGGRCP
jgi:hypothetical protein